MTKTNIISSEKHDFEGTVQKKICNIGKINKPNESSEICLSNDIKIVKIIQILLIDICHRVQLSQMTLDAY